MTICHRRGAGQLHCNSPHLTITSHYHALLISIRALRSELSNDELCSKTGPHLPYSLRGYMPSQFSINLNLEEQDMQTTRSLHYLVTVSLPISQASTNACFTSTQHHPLLPHTLFHYGIGSTLPSWRHCTILSSLCSQISEYWERIESQLHLGQFHTSPLTFHSFTYQLGYADYNQFVFLASSVSLFAISDWLLLYVSR